MGNSSVTIDLVMNSKRAKDSLARLNAGVAGWAKNFTAKFAKLGGKGGGGLGGLSKLVSGLTTKLAGLGSAFAAMASPVGIFLAAIAAVAAALVGLTVAITGAVIGLERIGRAFAKAGEFAQLAQWKFDIIFNKIKEKANKTAEAIAKDLGWSASTVKASMAKVGDIAKPLGLGQDAVLQMSAGIAQMTSAMPMWSLGMKEPQYAVEALTKALVGEKEMLKELGIVIEDTELRSYIEDQGKAFTPLNKAIATYNLSLVKARDLLQGSKEQGGTYTQSVIQMKEAWKEFKIVIGTDTMKVIKGINQIVIALTRKMIELWGSHHFVSARNSLKEIGDYFERIAATIADMDVVKEFSATFEKLYGAVQKFYFRVIGIGYRAFGKLLPVFAKWAGYTFFKYLWETLVTLIPDLVYGFINGISNALESSGDRMKSIFNEVLLDLRNEVSLFQKDLEDLFGKGTWLGGDVNIDVTPVELSSEGLEKVVKKLERLDMAAFDEKIASLGEDKDSVKKLTKQLVEKQQDKEEVVEHQKSLVERIDKAILDGRERRKSIETASEAADRASYRVIDAIEAANRGYW